MGKLANIGISDLKNDLKYFILIRFDYFPEKKTNNKNLCFITKCINANTWLKNFTLKIPNFL